MKNHELTETDAARTFAESLRRLKAASDEIATRFTPTRDTWQDLWLVTAERILDTAVRRLERLADGEIEIADPTAEVRSFWKEIIGRARTIWTTSFPLASSSGSGIGRDDDAEILAMQGDAIRRRQLEITRLFLYEPSDPKAMRELRSLISKQLALDVEVLAMNVKELKHRFRTVEATLGTFDFMIVDDRYVYTTVVSGKARRLESRLAADEATVTQAREFSRQITARAKRVTNESLASL